MDFQFVGDTGVRDDLPDQFVELSAFPARHVRRADLDRHRNACPVGFVFHQLSALDEVEVIVDLFLKAKEVVFLLIRSPAEMI